jgi:hypothetical protein
MHKDPLIEADYINYDYLEAKSVPGQILDRPVRSGLTCLDRYWYLPSKIQTGFISGCNIY